MVIGEFLQSQRVRDLHRQLPEAIGVHGSAQLLQIDMDSAEAGFDGDLPECGRTDGNVILGRCDAVAKRPRKLPIAGDPPQENVCVEEEDSPFAGLEQIIRQRRVEVASNANATAHPSGLSDGRREAKGNETRDRTPGPGNDHVIASRRTVDELRQPSLGFVNVHRLTHLFDLV